tara:strand:- start:1492 stop:2577 length:1086 start_codon:yes stop_codon:yes gene_type:complete
METLIEKSNPIAHEFPPLSNNYTVHVNSIEMLKNVQLDIDIQRELDPEWISVLKEKIIEHRRDKGFFFLGAFEVACLSNSLYMLNGQHRYFVVKDLHSEFKEEQIPVELKIYTVSSKEEMHELWMKVNGSKPSKLCKSTSTQVIINSIKKYFAQNYAKYLTNADKPTRPNINLDQLEKALHDHDTLNILKIDSSEEFVSMIEKLNNFYKYSDPSKWKSWGIDDALVLKCKTKNILKPLFLGIFANFEWLKRIIEVNKPEATIDNYSSIPHLGLNSKSRKISKAKRRRIWEKRCSKKMMIGKCFVCKRDIDYDTFEAGHILSHFWGGSTSLDNLEPICSICNKDMGVENLLKYKDDNYKNQI